MDQPYRTPSPRSAYEPQGDVFKPEAVSGWEPVVGGRVEVFRRRERTTQHVGRVGDVEAVLGNLYLVRFPDIRCEYPGGDMWEGCTFGLFALEELVGASRKELPTYREMLDAIVRRATRR